MAKTTKDQPREDGIITKKEFDKLMKRATAIDAEIAESKGTLGNAVRAAEEDHGLHKDAFRVVRKYLKKNADQRSAFFQNLQAYWEYAQLETETMFDKGDEGKDDQAAQSAQARKAEYAKSEGNGASTPALGRGDRKIDNGKVVPINGNGAQASA